jgi:rubrerythrin
MSEKPSYLGLLNALAVAECGGHAFFTAWADATPSADVRRVLLTVAAREGEHGMTFARRVNELGYELRPKDDPKATEQLALARSEMSDLEKMEKFGYAREIGTGPDGFDDFFKDHSIDVRTGELLGRYIAEERDSFRLLQACYRELKAAEPAGDVDPRSLGSIETKVDALCRAVDELRQIVCAQTMTSEPEPALNR